MSQNNRLTVLRRSLYAISSVVFVEFLGGFFANSMALISDAAHASFDAFTTFWLLYATGLSMKPPDVNHTYGHEKIETLGGQFGGMALLAVAGLLFYHSITRLLEGATMVKGLAPVALLAVIYTICVDVFRMKILSTAGGHSPSVKADFFHAAADFSSTIAALIGVTASSLGYTVGDALSSLVLSAFLGFLSVRLVYRTSLELSDISSSSEYQMVQSVLENIEGVKGFKGLRMRKAGSKHYIDATILLSSLIDVEKAHGIASYVEEKIRNSIGKAVVTIHCEPVKEELPFEQKIGRIVSTNENIKGVHKIISTTTDQGTFLTLHIETDPSLTLSEAHEISQKVERGIEHSFPNIKETTVHIESYPEADKGQMVREETDLRKIRQILASNPNIRRVSSVRVYLSERNKHVDITCSFTGTEPMEKIHREVSVIERQIKQSIGECTVTIHPEPL